MTHSRNDGNIAEKDLARTPRSLFKRLDEIYHFTIDAASNGENNLCVVCCTNFLDEGFHFEPSDCAYINPPYSRGNIDRFIKKGYEESLKGATVVMLLPSDTSTRYFHDYCMKASEIMFLKPRVRFNHPDGSPFKTSPKFGSMVVVFQASGFAGSPVISSLGWK
jgi:site-specific DNA-methyltransferase (adenine-specific)